MNKTSFTGIACWLLCNCAQLGAQTSSPVHLCRQVIASSGKSAERQGMHLDYTVGESAIFSLQTSNAYKTTQGFHQPELSYAVSPVSEASPPILLGLRLHPNPVADELRIVFEMPLGRTLVGQVQDLTGRTVLPTFHLTDADDFILDCQVLPPGYYLLRLSDEQRHQAGVLPFAKI